MAKQCYICFWNTNYGFQFITFDSCTMNSSIVDRINNMKYVSVFARGMMLIARVVKYHDGQSASDGEIKRHVRICHMVISNSHFDLC